MKIAILTINKFGERLARRIKKNFKDAPVFKLQENRKNMGKIFNEYEGLIFIAALGIVVRLISPFIKNKFDDPAVVCVDRSSRFSISVLSGHEGGANNLSYQVGACLGAIPVITTGKETQKRIILGIGCRKAIARDKIKKAIVSTLKQKDIFLEEIRIVATVDLKKDEKGLVNACSQLGLPLIFIPKEDIRNFKGNISSSKIVKRNIGLEGVCEPCALLAGRRTRLILKKQILDGVTIAIARES